MLSEVGRKDNMDLLDIIIAQLVSNIYRDNKIRFYQILRVKFEWQGEVQYEEYSQPGMVSIDDS